MGKRRGRMPMPSYYGKNIAQHTQRRVLKRQREERRKEQELISAAKELDRELTEAVAKAKREAEDGRR